MNTQLKEILKKSKTLSDLARNIFGKENYTNREKCKKILAENGVNWEAWLAEKKIKPKRYCLYCGKEITDGGLEKKFCNHSCSALYNNLQRTKKRYCLECGKELKSWQKKYCTHECQRIYEYTTYINEWKNGTFSGVIGKDEIAKPIRKYLFDKYECKCQRCGWGEKNLTTNTVPLQIHHIDGDCTNNKEENLQLLCPNCHSLTENFGVLNKGKSNRIHKKTVNEA